MVYKNSETSSQFEYRGEGNFFASLEMCGDRCSDSEEDKDEDKDGYGDRDGDLELESDMTSSGECWYYLQKHLLCIYNSLLSPLPPSDFPPCYTFRSYCRYSPNTVLELPHI